MLQRIVKLPCNNIHNSFKDINAWLRPNQMHCNKIQVTSNLSVHTRLILATRCNKINQQSITANQKSTWAGSLCKRTALLTNEWLIPSLVWKFMFPLIIFKIWGKLSTVAFSMVIKVTRNGVRSHNYTLLTLNKAQNQYLRSSLSECVCWSSHNVANKNRNHF